MGLPYPGYRSCSRQPELTNPWAEFQGKEKSHRVWEDRPVQLPDPYIPTDKIENLAFLISYHPVPSLPVREIPCLGKIPLLWPTCPPTTPPLTGHYRNCGYTRQTPLINFLSFSSHAGVPLGWPIPPLLLFHPPLCLVGHPRMLCGPPSVDMNWAVRLASWESREAKQDWASAPTNWSRWVQTHPHFLSL